jgi:iron-sulfur cluster assembly 1
MSLKPPPLAPTQAQPQDEANDFNVTIRFSASLPDLLLTIPGNLNANTATLKQLIRSHVPSDYAKHRIRLIYAGKALIDEVSLSASLRRNVSTPPSRIGTPVPPDDGGKGKAPVRDPPFQARIYIHCSIGDITLSPSELAEEASIAATTTPSKTISATQDVPPQTTTTPAPRGFDRLLTAGFSPSEVQSLRLQFLAIQAHTHTPDTMPSPSTLRTLEDRWLDGSTSTSADPNSSDTSIAAGGTAGFGGDEDISSGSLDDMILGTAMGFFWPVGCLVWGVRDDGIWTQRRKMAVVVGVLLNLGLGLIRFSG